MSTTYAPRTQYKIFMRDIENVTNFSSFMSEAEAIWGLDSFLSELHESEIFNTEISDSAPTDLNAIWIDPNNPGEDAPSVVKMYDGTNWVPANWNLFANTMISGSAAGAAQGDTVPSEESVISSDGEVMINPTSSPITVGSDPTQSGLEAQGFLTIADYISAIVAAAATVSVETINGIQPDASGNIDLSVHSQDFDTSGNVEFPIRDPSDTESKFEIYGYEDSTDGDKRKIGMFEIPPTGVPEIDVCPEDGAVAPPDPIDPSKTYSGDFYWAIGGDEPVLMMKRADGTFDAVGDFTENYALALNGSILNGLGVLPCNINFQNQGLTVDPEIKVRGSGYGWYKETGIGLTEKLSIPDKFIPYNATTAKKLSFWVKWDELTTTGLPPETFYVFLSPFDRDNVPMYREYFYPSPYGADSQDYLLNGVFTPQSFASAGPNIFLTHALNTGDTIVRLNDVSFWDANKTVGNYRGLRFLNYTDSQGTNYLEYSNYTPEFFPSEYHPSDVWGHFPESGVDLAANEITLNTPYTGPTVPAGTRVASSHFGGTFNYLIAESKSTHTAIASEGEWRNVQVIAPAGKNAEPFPSEVASVKIGQSLNYWGNPLTRPNPDSNYKFSFAAFFLGEGQTYESPDGHLWEIEVDNAGAVTATPL